MTEAARRVFQSGWYLATLAYAKAKHAGQTDKGGRPYIEHVERVAQILVRRWPNATQAEVMAALLHDVAEDTDTTPRNLFDDGFPIETCEIVALLSHSGTIPYDYYISMLARADNIGAVRVKLADNEDNSDSRRLGFDRDRLVTKYLPAKRALEAALAQLTGRPFEDAR